MKNSILRKFLLTIVILIIPMIVYFIFNINKNISENTQWINRAYNLKTINQNIDTLLSRKMNYYNYDDSNIFLEEINSFLNELDHDKKMLNFLEKEHNNIKNIEIYNEIKMGFNKREKLVNKFKSTNAVLNNSLRYITTILIENKDELKEFIELHSLIMQLSLGVENSLHDIKSKIKKLEILYDNSNDISHLYLKHINVIVNHYEILEDIEEQNLELNFDSRFSIFIIYLNDYAYEMTNNLNFLMMFLIVLVIFMFVSIIILFNKKLSQGIALKKFKQAVENSDNIILITDISHKIEYVNEAFFKSTGYSPKDIVGQTPAMLKSGYHSKEFYNNLSKILTNGKKWSGEFINKDSKNKLIYEKATITPILDEDGNICNYIAIKLDITSEKEYQKEIEIKNIEIEKRYYTDYLTGLGNRNQLMKMLEEGKEDGRLIYIDVDNFTQIKTFYGLLNSDLLLQEIANELKIFKNTLDFDSYLFRIKLDEYCLWSKGSTKNPKNIIKKIQNYIENKEFIINGIPIMLTVTIGSSRSVDKKNKNRYTESEIAHHDAKSKQVNYNIYTPKNSIESGYRNNIVVSNLIQDALATEKVTICFQPIYDMKTMEIYMYEVLVRIIDSNGYLLPPMHFLNISKKSNYYHEIMKVVITKTFLKLDENPDKKFSINFSTLDFNHQPTFDLLFYKLKNVKNPNNISIEILESENIENFDDIKTKIKQIKEFGCKIGIDDFGSGHSNYYRLSILDADYIKIDGSIIKNLDTDKHSLAVLETIMTFSKKMNYPIVAEFVHKKEILDIIKSYKIDYAQGYYLREPKSDIG